ncbi:MAG: magnesium transporter [Nitrososphaera sp.]
MAAGSPQGHAHIEAKAVEREEDLEVHQQKRQDSVSNNGLTWTYMQRPAYADLAALGQQRHPSFHRLNFEDCLSKIQIPKIDRYDDHIFVVLHFPTPDKERGFVFSQLSMFIGADYLVTVHQGELRPVEELFNMCKADERMRQTIMGRSSGYLVHKIIDTLVDDLLHLLMKVVGNIDDVEDLVFDERISVSRQIALLRREITTLRRIVIHLRRTVLDLTKDVQRFSKEDLAAYFKDVQDHVDKVYETLEEAKETVEIYKDTDFVLSTEKTNKILAVLTIIFTLSIPASIVSTFYGMNINLPGGIQTGEWTQLGPYTTLIFVIIISAAPAGLMFVYFHKLGWLEAHR